MWVLTGEKIDDAIVKLDEEIGEFKEAVMLNEQDKIVDEAGDILFSLVNVLRFKKVDADAEMR